MHTHTVQEAHPRHEQRKETSTEIWFLFPRTVYGICCYLVCMLILYRRLIRDKNKEKRRHPKYGSFSPELWHILLAMHSRLTLSTLEYTGRRLIREPVLCYYIILLYLQPALTKPYYYHVYAVHPLVILTRADCMHSTHSLYFC